MYAPGSRHCLTEHDGTCYLLAVHVVSMTISSTPSPLSRRRLSVCEHRITCFSDVLIFHLVHVLHRHVLVANVSIDRHHAFVKLSAFSHASFDTNQYQLEPPNKVATIDTLILDGLASSHIISCVDYHPSFEGIGKGILCFRKHIAASPYSTSTDVSMHGYCVYITIFFSLLSTVGWSADSLPQ